MSATVVYQIRSTIPYFSHPRTPTRIQIRMKTNRNSSNPTWNQTEYLLCKLRIVTKWLPTNNPTEFTERGHGAYWDFRTLAYKDLPFWEHPSTLQCCTIGVWKFVELSSMPSETLSRVEEVAQKFANPLLKTSHWLEKCLYTHQQKFTFRRTHLNTFCTQKEALKCVEMCSLTRENL